MKADFFDCYFDELKKEELAILKRKGITKEEMPDYSNMTIELTQKQIAFIIKRLGIKELPDSYFEYLKHYGDGGYREICIYGIYNKKKGSTYKLESKVLDITLYYRKIYKFSKYFVVVAVGKWSDNILFCLDTSRMKDGECPVIAYNQNNYNVKDYASNFSEFVRKYINYTLHSYVEKGREKEENKERLLKGIERRCYWMTVKGANDKILAEVLDLSYKKKMTWEEGCAYLNNYKNLDKKPIMISSRYQGKIYIIGNGLAAITYDLKKLLKIGEICNSVYFYFTDYVLESYGFAKLKKGEIERLYFSDEDRIWNMGNPSKAEKELNFCFPRDFNQVFEKNYTSINEDCIISIASKWTPEDLKNYPYKDVIVGNVRKI